MINSAARSSISSKSYYRSMLAGNTAYNPITYAYDLLTTSTLSSSVSAVTFDVSTYAALGYKDLQVRIIGRTDRSASGGDYIRLRFNNDTSSNYSLHVLGGNGSSAYSEAQTNVAQMNLERLGSSDLASGAFGAIVIDIIDFSSTAKYKTVKSLGGVANSYVMLCSGNWRSTAAITTINIPVGGGSNFVTGSRFSLYGIKG